MNLVKLAERLIETLILNKTSEFLKAAENLKHHKEGTFLCIPLLPSPVAAIGLFQDPGEAQDLKTLLQRIRGVEGRGTQNWGPFKPKLMPGAHIYGRNSNTEH